MLLPPKVQGPINTTATSIVVLGAVDGAAVQVLVNGAPAGVPTTASGLSTTVPLGATVLSAGQQVTATQSKAADTSAPSTFAETVAAAPSAATGLGPLAFLSGVHPCIDWVVLGGTTPGATVRVLHGGHRVGETVAGGTQVSVPVRFSPAAVAGDRLFAVQTFTPAGGAAITGADVPSLPMSAAPPGEPSAPTVAPPMECDLAVLVAGLNEGTSLIVKHNADEIAGYPFVGTPVWAGLARPVRGADQLSAKQHTEQCGAASGFGPAVGVNPAPKLPTPVIVGPVCPTASLLRVRNLRPGALVTIFGETQQPSSSAAAQIGQVRAWAVDCEFGLPANWASLPNLVANPGKLFITVFQENCDKGSDTAKLAVEPLPGLVGQPGMAKPVECGRVIGANTLTPGAVVIVTSDQADSPTLSGPVFVTASNLSIGLYRPLRALEHVQIKQTGCNAASDSAPTEVAPFGGVEPPVIAGPVRIPHGGINLKKLVVGARVHIFVNGALRVSVDATATSMFVPVAGLTREAVVTARQAMCVKISDESNREVAQFGELRVSHAPSPITRTKPTSIAVSANDRETDQAVIGNVKIGGAVVGKSGTAFGFTFPAGAAPASTVEATDYQAAAIAWNLIDAPPAAPAMLHLAIANQAPTFFTLTGVTWNILRQDPAGLTPISSPTGQSVAVTLPTNGQYHVHATVSVDDLVNGGNILAEFRGNVVTGGVSRLVVVWSNVDHTQNFRLFAESQVIFGGGTAVTVYNPVVAV